MENQDQPLTKIIETVSDYHPPRACSNCAKEFRARLVRIEHLHLCYPCAERWKRFCEVCPPLYQSCDPDRLPCGPEGLRKVLAWQYGPRGLLLHGATGRGKTRAAWLLVRRLLDEGREVVAFDAVSFSHEVQRRFSGDGDGPKWADRLAQIAVIFFDDAGKCRLTDRGEAELFGLIERRMANCRPIIATTNFVGDTLAANLRDDVGRALVRRLRESCERLAF